jgi:uncharacterized damage-inducible protein DinB
MKDFLLDYIKYNLWANQKLIDLLVQQDNKLLEKEVNSSFPSIRATLLHIWDAQEIWLGRLEGRSMTYFPSKFFEGSMEEVFNGLLNSSLDFLHYATAANPEIFEENCYYKTTSGSHQTQLKKEMILHCMNHGSYHRGQIITICHQIGITDLPATDYIFYLREKKKATSKR